MPVDLVFLLDGSGSITAPNFEITKSFVQNTTSDFQIGTAHTQVGVVQYEDNPYDEFPLNQYATLDELLTAIRNITYRGGGTQTGKAIDHVVDNSLTESHGARPGVPKVVIVVTDGQSWDSVVAPAQRANHSGIIMVAIGVGSGYDINELMEIASSNDTLGTIEYFLRCKYLKVNNLTFLFQDINECELPNNCSQLCTNTNGSFACACQEGFVLEPDGEYCQHKDECATGENHCDQVCENTPGSYGCLCEDGYILTDDPVRPCQGSPW
uniref:VWFA domain-containing protein n=1 Tax=Branchiostoma floridae TaxID=7739 RepID=C3XS83_BRAFL|eukprot:XP_002613089.1 hypothetical protein BRAFLDRAFT_89971 [Branchiostoma floridae]